jgi:hypothetical protein
MDYGQLLKRTWNVVWTHKFLILLGVLVALSSVGSSSGINASTQWNARQVPQWEYRGPPGGDTFPRMPDLRRPGPLAGIPILVALVLGGLALVVGVAVWIVSTIARGGLIAGADAADGGGRLTFGEAFSAGWRRGWTLLGIGLLPAIPGAVLVASALGAAGIYTGMGALLDNAGMGFPRTLLAVVLGGLVCIALPASLVLGLLRTFANRACMIEGVGVWDAYKQGGTVLWDHIGSALLLFLIQIGISLALGVATLLPNVVLALCCIGWPILLLAQGAIAAFFSTMWTLAWRRWTDRTVGALAVEA